MEISVNGTKLFYEREGNGPWLVMLHGLGASSEIWNEVAPTLAKDSTVLRVDTRGAGRSERKPGDYSINLFADDLIALLEQVGVDRATLLGVSMGGIIGMTAALKRPDLVEALVLCDSTAELPPQGKAGVTERGRVAEAEGMAAVVPIQLQGAFTPEFLAADPPIVQLYRRVLLENDPACFAATTRAIVSHSVLARLGEIKQPTLIVCGENDPVTPLAASQQLNQGIAGSQLEVIPGMRHMAPLERRDQFIPIVQNFLAGIRARA